MLHAFPRNVSGNGRVVRLARNLIDFVDVDDAALGLVHFVIAVLQQLLDDVLDVFAHVAGFGQRGGVSDDERDVQEACQRLCEQGLARASRPDEQDVALRQLDIILLAEVLQTLVMVVDRDRQNLLGLLLTNHILVEALTDFMRCRQIGLDRKTTFLLGDGGFVPDDFIAQVDTFIADEDRRAGNQFFDLMLALAAERAVQQLFASRAFLVRHNDYQ